MRQIFVDAGPFIALADVRDQYHQQAEVLFARINALHLPQVTTNLVVAEATTFVRRRSGHAASVLFGDNLREIVKLNQLTVIYANATLDEAAWQIFKRHAEQSFSYVDCISFAWLKQNLRTEVFTFDEHFRWMGFKVFA
jgi:predicted nucleic acid-binding protein